MRHINCRASFFWIARWKFQRFRTLRWTEAPFAMCFARCFSMSHISNQSCYSQWIFLRQKEEATAAPFFSPRLFAKVCETKLEQFPVPLVWLHFPCLITATLTHNPKNWKDVTAPDPPVSGKWRKRRPRRHVLRRVFSRCLAVVNKRMAGGQRKEKTRSFDRSWFKTVNQLGEGQRNRWKKMEKTRITKVAGQFFEAPETRNLFTWPGFCPTNFHWWFSAWQFFSISCALVVPRLAENWPGGHWPQRCCGCHQEREDKKKKPEPMRMMMTGTQEKRRAIFWGVCLCYMARKTREMNPSWLSWSFFRHRTWLGVFRPHMGPMGPMMPGWFTRHVSVVLHLDFFGLPCQAASHADASGNAHVGRA